MEHNRCGHLGLRHHCTEHFVLQKQRSENYLQKKNTLFCFLFFGFSDNQRERWKWSIKKREETMKNQNKKSKWITFARIATFSLTLSLAPTVFSGASIPLTRDFLNGLGSSVTTNSLGFGRIQLVADSAALKTNNIPSGIVLMSESTKNKILHVNFYNCNRSVVLHRQGMYLRRPTGGNVTFAVYQKIADGNFSLIATNLVLTTANTNLLYSGAMDVFLEKGKQYAFGAAWKNTMGYNYIFGKGAQPRTVPFGKTFAAGHISANPLSMPASLSTNLIQSTLLYSQSLIWSTNRVVRMDENGGWSTNRLDLTVSLAGYDEVSLSFRHRSSGDETHAADGIYLSVDNGAHFTKIQDLGHEPLWTLHGIDLDQVAQSNAMTLANKTVIRFQQTDNLPWPRDGREFDDIRVYSKPILSLQFPSSSNAVVVHAEYCPVGTHCQLFFRNCLTNHWMVRPDGGFQTDAFHPTTNWFFYPDTNTQYFFKLETTP